MIYDKIKIYVTARIAETINKDTESFEFFKKDGRTPNKNAFLTQLVVNYFDEFKEKQNQLYIYLNSTIGKKARLKDGDLKQLCFEISEQINNATAAPDNEKFEKLVSLKPTKQSQAIIDYIEAYELEGSSLSEYFRNMFASYAAMPQDKREGVIFKKQKAAIEDAIRNGKKIFLQVEHKEKSSMEISPYAISSSKEELHYYILGHDGKSCIPLRLSRIVSVTPLHEVATFDELSVSVFERMLTYGPQFFYLPYEKEIKVELTRQGVEKFKKIFLHRPTPCAIDGNVYTFKCSYAQIIQYFERFGADAFILSPVKVREKVFNFYSRAYKYYIDKTNVNKL